MENPAISNFQKMIDVNLPIIFICDFDYVRVDDFILKAVGENASIEEWNPGTGSTNFDSGQSISNGDKVLLQDFLKHIYEMTSIEDIKIDGYIILREIQDFIDDPKVKTLLALIAQRKLYDPSFDKTIIIVSSVRNVPEELKHYVSYFDYDFPSDDEIEELIKEHIRVNGYKEREDLSELKLTL